MDSQPSGNSNELFFVETDKVYFSIKGKENAACYGEENHTTIIVDNKEIHDSQYRNLYFKEYTNYEVVIERKGYDKIEFYHENHIINKSITPTGRRGDVLSGIINFNGDIGYSDLYVKVNGNIHMKLIIEVIPTKIDYKEDYKALIQDVNEEIYNLAFGFLSRTYLGTDIVEKNNASYSEFYSILSYVYEKLIKAINIVLYMPHHELVKNTSIRNYQSLKSSSVDTIKWLEKRPYLLENIGGSYIPTRALQINKEVTLNTKENKFLKFILIKIVKKIEGFLKVYDNKNKDVISKLTKMKRDIEIKIKTSFLKDVTSEFRGTDISLVFSMASGYKEIYKYYLMLQKGLSINSNVFSLSMKELSILYEYWCFIKINSLIRRKYKLISSDFISSNTNGIFITLKKGIESTLVYENPRTGELFRVVYNSNKSNKVDGKGSRSKTVTQKPDNVLEINKNGCNKSYEFIFDAKYKIETSNKYKKKYGGIGPKEEDINTMHRYRDAIVYKNKNSGNYDNSVFGAFVLFPYNNEDEYRTHAFYNSIEDVNIGAIPFLPSSTKLMEEFLDSIINESSYSTFERALNHLGYDEYMKDEYFNDRCVLVGALRNKEQFKANLEGKFYHTRCSNVDLVKNKVRYIALAQSITNFEDEAGITYYGKVANIKTVKRRDIKELYKYSGEEYYVFEVESWSKLDRKIKVKGYQVRKVIYTTEFLLKNADMVTELCIKSKEEYRLWKELKRLDNALKIEANKDISKDTKIDGFTVDDIKVIMEVDDICILSGLETKHFSRIDFNKKPRYVIEEILKVNKY